MFEIDLSLSLNGSNINKNIAVLKVFNMYEFFIKDFEIDNT